MNVDPMVAAGADARSRIIAVANELHARSGGKFPSVAAVRQAAQVDMNTASAVMREWRRERQLPSTATTVPLPESVVRMANVALASVWNCAADIAGEALRNAQAAWAEERSQTEHHLQQIVDAFDGQTAELTATRESLHDANGKLDAANATQQALQARITRCEEQLVLYLADRDRALADAARAREECARLKGQLEALVGHNAELLARFGGGAIKANSGSP